MLRDHRVEQGDQLVIVPDAFLRALRRNEDEREVLLRLHQLGRAVDRNLGDVCAALAGAMQEKHKRPFLLAAGLVALGQEEQVVEARGFGHLFLEVFALLHGNIGIVLSEESGGSQESQGAKEFKFHGITSVLITSV